MLKFSLRQRVQLNSIIVSLLFLSQALVVLFPFIPGGITIIILGLSFLSIVVNADHTIYLNRYKKALAFSGYIFLFFVVSLVLFIGEKLVITYFFYFLILGVLPMLMMQLPFDEKLIFKNFTYILPVLLLLVYRIDISAPTSTSDMADYNQYTMLLSFRVLTLLLISFIILITRKSWVGRLFYLVIFFGFLYFISQMGSRSPIVAALLFFMTVLMLRKGRAINIGKYILIASAIGIALYYLFINYGVELLRYFGISFPFLDRVIWYMTTEGDITSGRLDLYGTTIDQIIKSPLWGYGIASFGDFSGIYPHNLFLQLLYEGGILLFIPFAFIIIKSVKIVTSNIFNVDVRFFLILMMFSSLFILMFSAQYWSMVIFWCLLGYVIRLRRLGKKGESNSIPDVNSSSKLRFN